MRFILTVIIPNGRMDKPIHQVFCQYDANSLEEFVSILNSKDFLIVDELYWDANSKNYYVSGQTAINYRFIGKIRELEEYAKT